MMKKIFLLALAISLNVLAQEEYKYIMPMTLSWEELQVYQMDSLKSAKELNLAETCPNTLRKLQATHERTGQIVGYILGNIYIRSEYTNSEGLKCLVKHEKIDTLSTKENKIINPNEYELLNTTQARVLKSASQGVGFKKKGVHKKLEEANLYNQRVNNKRYEKYGGYVNLKIYMRDNIPESSQKDRFSMPNKTYYNPDGTVDNRIYSTIDKFKIRYSEKQQRELIESVQNKIKKKESKKQSNELNRDSEQTLTNNNIKQYIGHPLIVASYPRHLAIAGIEGYVTIEFNINGGYATEIEIIDSYPVGAFDETVLNGMKFPGFNQQEQSHDGAEIRYRYTKKMTLEKTPNLKANK